MDDQTAKYRDSLRANGQSNTVARYRVFETLKTAGEPLSLPELADLLSGKADRSSIYRTVGLFEQLGIIKKIYTGWKYKIELGDDYQSHHHHLTCVSCAKIVPIKSLKLENALVELGRQNGFTVTDHVLELRGYCKNCQN